MTRADTPFLRNVSDVADADRKNTSVSGLVAHYEPQIVYWVGQITCNSTAVTNAVQVFPFVEHAVSRMLRKLDFCFRPLPQVKYPTSSYRNDLLDREEILLFDWEESFPVREDSSGRMPGSVDTTPTLPTSPQNPEAEIEEFFHTLQEQNFDEAGEDDFLKALTFFITRYGEKAVAAIAQLVLSGGIPEDLASETLRQLGYLAHFPSYESRLKLFEQGLSSESEQVRYTAALGLASLDDPRAIPYLKQAIEREKYADLRKVFAQALEQLENAR